MEVKEDFILGQVFLRFYDDNGRLMGGITAESKDDLVEMARYISERECYADNINQ